MFQRTFLTGFALTLLVVQACGSNDSKKRLNPGEAGMGGEAGTGGEPSSGGSAAGEPAGVGGVPTPSAGTGGEGAAPSAGNGGEAGQPSVPEPELLFTVKPGATGLPDTAVAGQTEPQNVIYSSKTASQNKIDGTNEVKLLGETLGLAAADQIVAFTTLQPEPQNPQYLFSMADGSEGGFTTRVHESWDNGSLGGTEAADIYFSDGVPSYRGLGEGGDQYGYNGLIAHRGTLGLTDDGDGIASDLSGLLVHDARVPLTEIYFTVSASAEGVADSAVEATPAGERACTVFRSGLDGTNSVAFSCDELGLVANAEIDALLVYGAEEPSKVVFSVTHDSQGAEGTAVEAAVSDGAPGATLFESLGDSSNSVHKEPEDLGLGYLYDDELDALAVVDRAPPSVVHAASCTFVYDPLDVAEGGLSTITGASHIGPGVMVLFGLAGGIPRYLAYNASTCAFLQQKDMPGGFSDSNVHAIAPLAAWSAATPLDGVEHFRADTSGSSPQKFIKRYDDAGAYLDEVPISTVSSGDSVAALVHEPVSNRLYLLSYNDNYFRQYRLAIMPRPNGVLTSLDPPVVNLTTPCNQNPSITGTDPLGNLYVAQWQNPGTEYRVCGYSPNGELLPSPYFWTPQEPTKQHGFIVPGASHFLLSGSTENAIERGVYQEP